MVNDINARIAANADNVRDARARAANNAEPPIRDGDVSLILRETDQDVCFVVWLNVVSRTARRVTVDNLGRVVAIVPYAVPVITPHALDTTILITRTGIVMMRFRRTERPSMPH